MTRRPDIPVLIAVLLGASALLTVAIAPPRPLPAQPFPDAPEYADVARHIAVGEGFATTILPDGPRPTRYPPGFPVALVPFALAGDYPANVQVGARVLAVVYVVSVLVAAWALGGPTAAAVAGAALTISPFAATYAGLVLSDAYAAASALGILAILGRRRRGEIPRPLAFLAGLLAAVALATRYAALPALVGLLAALPPRRWPVAALGLLPILLPLAAYQWATFGAPATTGYGDLAAREMRLDHAWQPRSDATPGDSIGIVRDRLHGVLLVWACPCGPHGPEAQLPNVLFYPAVLAGLDWIYHPPLFGVLGAVALWRRRASPAAIYSALAVGGTAAIYMLYSYQGGRFMATAASLLLVYGAVAVADSTSALTRRIALAPRPGGDRAAAYRHRTS